MIGCPAFGNWPGTGREPEHDPPCYERLTAEGLLERRTVTARMCSKLPAGRLEQQRKVLKGKSIVSCSGRRC